MRKLLYVILILPLFSAISPYINFQGKLQDLEGVGVTDTLDAEFRIYNSAISGEPLWIENTSIEIEKGLFTVILGLADSITLPFDEQYWIEIIIDEDELSPRLPLVSSPYAFRTLYSDSSNYAMFSDTSEYALNVGDSDTSLFAFVSDTAKYLEGLEILAGDGILLEPDTITLSGIINVIYCGNGESTGVSRCDHHHWAQEWSGTDNGLILTGYSSDIILQVTSDSLLALPESYTGSVAIAGGTSGENSVGILGMATQDSDTSRVHYGVMGKVLGNGGVAVVGQTEEHPAMGFLAGSLDSVFYGAYGESEDTDGAGVGGDGGEYTNGIKGMSSARTRSGYTAYAGVYGINDAEAIFTPADSSETTIAGVIGYTEKGYGAGVIGIRSRFTRIPFIGLDTVSPAKNDTVVTSGVLGVGGTFSGVYGYSTGYVGVYGSSGSDAAASAGVRGDNFSPAMGGKGVYGYSKNGHGVYGRTDAEGSGYRGVYFSGGLSGSGDKNCVVRTEEGPKLLYSQESPEVWFEDFGISKLIYGKAEVKLREDFIEVVTINKEHPFLVFIQPYSPIEGLKIERKNDRFILTSENSSDKEIEFAYRLVAKRKGFENKRLDLYPPAYDDPYLYPENNQKGDESN